MPLIKIATLNVRGLNESKAVYLLDFIIRSKIDVCLLQETHIKSSSELEKIESVFYQFSCVFPLCESNSKGVGFLIRKNSNIITKNIFHDLNNRVLGCEVCFDNISFNLVTVYCPNSIQQQVEFTEELYDVLNTKKRVLLVGDFNFVEDKLKDRENLKQNIYEVRNEQINIKSWHNFFQNLLFTEIEWQKNNQKRGLMTWTNGIQASRIDRFYKKVDFPFVVEYVDNKTFSMSDHRMIVASVTTDKKITKSKNSHWKLNESILNVERIHKKILGQCERIPLKIKTHSENWYDVFIREIVKMLKFESRRENVERNKNFNDHFSALSLMDKTSQTSENYVKEKNALRRKIEQHYEEKKSGHEKRVRDERMTFFKQPTKVLIEKEMRKAKSCELKEYECMNGEKTTDQETILNDVHSFYSNLLGTDKVADEKINSYAFKIRPLKEEQDREMLNSDISYDEVYECVKKMSDAAPGSNGLTIGFYKKYFPYFGKYYVDVLNHSQTLPDVFKESIIKLIPKNSKEVKTVNDMRPISLTNYEYRIFTKVMANRIRKISMKLIGENQTCSILGRRINDNIVQIRDIIEDANTKNKETFVVSVDQSKAFDSISHKYLFKLLKHLNLGYFFENTIRRLYSNSYACVEVNKEKSNKIFINSGMKQGCALSMILYVLSIEELIVRVNLNEQIKGYKLSVLKKTETKISGYADDLNATLSNYDSIKGFFNETNGWCEVSGAKVNKNKTKILGLNTTVERYETIKFVDDMKILGVIFNKSGPAAENISKAVNKVSSVLSMWQNITMNELERIAVCKTFALSKLWYIANFMVLSEKSIKCIERKLYKFIWCGSIEQIKRGTLILPYDRGGLNMMNIRAKLKTIMFQNFVYTIQNIERSAHQLSVYWMKFLMRDFVELKNFNIIPQGEKKERPLFYEKMIECVCELKRLDCSYALHYNQTKTCESYALFVKQYEIRPKIESKYVCLDWREIYNNIHNTTVHSELRALNYKILFDALPCNQRFNNRIKQNCFLCDSCIESRDHLFIDCSFTRSLVGDFTDLLDDRLVSISINKFIFGIQLTKHDSKIISLFKFVLWKLRNKCRTSQVLNKKALFNTFFHFYFERFF